MRYSTAEPGHGIRLKVHSNPDTRLFIKMALPVHAFMILKNGNRQGAKDAKNPGIVFWNEPPDFVGLGGSKSYTYT